jgi:hypothetical protein
MLAVSPNAVSVQFVALHVLGDLVYSACAVTSPKYMPVSFANVSPSSFFENLLSGFP